MFLGDSDLISYDHLDTTYILIFCATVLLYYITRSKTSDSREVFRAKIEIFKQKIIVNLLKNSECFVTNSF